MISKILNYFTKSKAAKAAKNALIEAITKLASDYKKEVVSHGLISCPLCNVCYVDDNDGGYCVGCPNQAFDNLTKCDSRACVKRGIAFTNINYMSQSNNINLSKFWSEVLVLIKASSAVDVQTMSDGLKAKILIIAKKYNNEAN